MAVYTPNLVTIGVDGLGTYQSEGKDIPTRACKALATGNTVYVASGQIPEQLKNNVLAIGDWFGTEDFALNSSALGSSVQAMLTRIRTSDAGRFPQGARILTLVAARPNHGGIRFRVTAFTAAQFGDVTASHQDITETGVTFDSAANGYRPTIPKNFATANPLKLVRIGIQGAFKRPGSFSGPPITLLQVTPDKIRWVTYGNCQTDGGNTWDTTPPSQR